MSLSYPLTWLEINAKAFAHNIKQIKKLLPKSTKFMAVIKAEAYGHGLLDVAQIIENDCQQLVDYLAVFDFSDAISLRQNGCKMPILVLGPIVDECFALALRYNIEITIANFEALKQLHHFCKVAPKTKEQLNIHICVDTGMGRDGFILRDVARLMKQLKNAKNFITKGCYAHFAAADNAELNNYTEQQIQQFLVWQQHFYNADLEPIFHHNASAGSIRGYDFELSRAGIAIYGLWPSLEMRDALEKKLKLLPALSWKAKVVEVRHLPKGSAISYNCTYKLKRNSKLAVLPIGYYDGLPRLASNQAQFLINGRKVAQIGRITMNMTVLDVTEVKSVKVGDVVTVIGSDGKNRITAEDWGVWAQTINYEITTRINPDLARLIK